MLLTIRSRLLEAFEAHTGKDDIPRAVVDSLDPQTRELILLEYVSLFYGRLAKPDFDPRQQWLQLGLPQYSHVVIQKSESLIEYRVRTEMLARRIKSYGYARRSDDKLDRDEKELRERKALEAKLAPFFAGDTLMTVDRAVELLAESMEKPARKQRREASKLGVKARLARTKNQQLPVSEK
jgi:hypothetical protein